MQVKLIQHNALLQDSKEKKQRQTKNRQYKLGFNIT